ncbi:MAG: tripartite tricarboxylate transporter TctB family protein, partial [Usitatibacter sp.]
MTPSPGEIESPALAQRKSVETVTLALLLAFSLLLAWDNWRTGARWESTGPQAGYFPFYVALILAGACVYGLLREIALWKKSDDSFVTRDQFKRVLQVFIPTLLFVPVTQFMGLYVASFALIAGFMYW